MELFDSRSKIPHDLQEKYINHTVRSNSDRIISQLRTLPLHSKLVFCACTRLLGQDKKNFKATVTDVFMEYKKLAIELGIGWLSLNKVNDLIKELEMLGFLNCSYPRKGQIKYIRILERSEIPRYVSALQEDLRKDTRDPISK